MTGQISEATGYLLSLKALSSLGKQNFELSDVSCPRLLHTHLNWDSAREHFIASSSEAINIAAVLLHAYAVLLCLAEG